jgi:A/G-specific adenine glycosylase
VVDGDRVLLQQRPDKGIWGGLLSLPEIGVATEEGAMRQAIAPFGVAVSLERLPMLSHVFTHFKLRITPYQVKLARRFDLVGECGHVWYAAAELANAPLPAPIKKLLLSVFREPDLLTGV